MDQTPPFQPSFNLDFFAPLHLPHNIGLADSMDIPKRKASFADHHADPSAFMDHSSFYLPQGQDDMYHESFAGFKGDAQMRNWQPPQAHNFLDVNLDPWFGNREKEFGMDPYQICRSRGGSFNFGRLRRDSEDFFHMNSDFFRHIRNITESKLPFENNVQKKPLQMPDAVDMQNNFADHTAQPLVHELNQSAPQIIAPTFPSNLQGTPMMATTHNTDSTVESAIETANDAAAKKRGRKKRMLNDKTECFDEPNSAKASKAGRPKKIKEEEDSIQAKPQKSKNSKGAKIGFDMENVKQEKDDKSTEISSNASKIEDSPNYIKPNSDIMSEIMKLKAPENLKEILGGMNVPNEVKEFFQKTNWMAAGNAGESRKIGTLTIAERRVKIEKYLQKRKKRTWSRKINYDCRKRVADSRLRIKGRFVTRDQAFTLMDEANIPFNPDTITNAEIKTLLTEKFGGSVLKKKTSDKQDTILCLKRPSERELDENDFEDDEDSALSE